MFAKCVGSNSALRAIELSGFRAGETDGAGRKYWSRQEIGELSPLGGDWSQFGVDELKD